MTDAARHEEPGEESADFDEPRNVYEIRLQGKLAADLRRQFPRADVVTTRTETVLHREVDGPAELDELVAQLLSLGVVLTEVRQVEPGDPVTAQGPGQARSSR